MHSLTMKRLGEFPGFAIRYSPSDKPFFAGQVIEDLRKIESVALGKTLLSQIAQAKPKARAAGASARAELKAIPFPTGVNVVIVPTTMSYTQSGYKMDWAGSGTMDKTMVASAAGHHNVKGCPYHPAGGSCAEAIDITAAGDGTGSVSLMNYTNAQVVTGKGEPAHSFLVLAHELIHSLHHLTGTRKDKDEELWTTGLNTYANEPMSENAFRKAFGLKIRTTYY